MPHDPTTLAEEGELKDDFDSVFGEKSGNNSTIMVAEDNRKSLPVETSKSKDPMKDILSRKPPTISPTLPKLEMDLNSLRRDPLDLDEIPVSYLSPAKEKRSRPRSTTNATSKISRKPSVVHSQKVPSTKPAIRQPFVNKSPSSAEQIQDYLNAMQEIYKKEQFTDTIDDWKHMMKSIEKTETAELANPARDVLLLSTCLIINCWVSEHLIDLILKKIQAKSAIDSSDNSFILTQIAQVSALRETARHSYLRAQHYFPSSSNLSIFSYMPLHEFVDKLNKKNSN